MTTGCKNLSLSFATLTVNPFDVISSLPIKANKRPYSVRIVALRMLQTTIGGSENSLSKITSEAAIYLLLTGIKTIPY